MNQNQIIRILYHNLLGDRRKQDYIFKLKLQVIIYKFERHYKTSHTLATSKV